MLNDGKWISVYRQGCEENEMVFVSHEVPLPATSDQRSRVAGNGTECDVKTIELSSPTNGGEQWNFLNLHNFTAVKKTVSKLRKFLLQAWWGNDTYKAFADKQQCFVKQYNQYHYEIFDEIPTYKGPSSVNGTRTLGENIAGNPTRKVFLIATFLKRSIWFWPIAILIIQSFLSDYGENW